MGAVLALPKLFDDVVARFALESVAVPNVFGWRARSQRPSTTKRIVWVPGEDGNAGELGAARHVGRDPRPLATLEERFEVDLEAQDATGAEDERKQYQAARELFDVWFRAAHLAARNTLRVRGASWVGHDRRERQFGATLRVACSIEAPVFDAGQDIAPAETIARIDTSLLSRTEQTLVAAPVDVATTGPITLSGLQTVDGVALAAGDRVLVKDQVAAQTNGLYVAGVSAWSRAADADTSAEVPSGLLVFVAGGVNGPAEWVLTTPAPIVLDTTPLTFARRI